MSGKYYEAYEKRYQAVQAVSPDFFWGHTPQDEELRNYLADWTEKHSLKGKTIVEFCCGEGGSGVVLSELGCRYQGFDIAPAAISKARELLLPFPNARAEVRDLVREPLPERRFDGVLDVMGFHMIVVDADRKAYLNNMISSLKPGAPAFFFHQSYRTDAYEGEIASFADWERISGSDYRTLQTREIGDTGATVEIPLVPARARSKDGFIREFEAAGFVVDKFIEMGENTKCPFSASIFAHRPAEDEAK